MCVQHLKNGNKLAHIAESAAFLLRRSKEIAKNIKKLAERSAVDMNWYDSLHLLSIMHPAIDQLRNYFTVANYL